MPRQSLNRLMTSNDNEGNEDSRKEKATPEERQKNVEMGATLHNLLNTVL